MQQNLRKILSLKGHWKKISAIVAVNAVWTISVFLLFIWFQGQEKTFQQFGKGDQFYLNLIYMIMKGSFVYYILIFYLIIPLVRRPTNKKIWLQGILFFVLLTVYEYYHNYYVRFPDSAEHESIPVRTFFLTSFFLDFIEVLVSVFIATLVVSNEMRRHKSELEKEKLKAELAAIKYQINPHFLFNSLSFIYTKAIKSSPEAAHAVGLLSEIMSYALEERDEFGMIPIAVEVAQLNRVVEMNQIRFNHKLKIKYDENIEVDNAQVPIFILVTLVENAFKHGDLTDEKYQLTIELKVTESKIHFWVRNKKKKGNKEPSKGIGLNNVRQRLEMMYGSEHSFTIEEDEDYYMSHVAINF